MAASLLYDAATFALRVAFDLAMKRHAPVFILHGPTAAPARNRVLDAAVHFLLDTVVVVIHIALWSVFLVVVLAILLLVLFACCFVAALAAIVFYLDRARASRSREQRLAVLSFVSLFLLAVAVFLMVVLFLATVDGEE